jgi:hypothetical protein
VTCNRMTFIEKLANESRETPSTVITLSVVLALTLTLAGAGLTCAFAIMAR